MPEPSEIQRDLMTLEAELKKLEAEYNMFFSGRLPRPPWETRGRVDSLIKRWGRAHIQAAVDRFRFFERPETIALDRREVNEHVAPAVALNEPVTLGVVEPLDLACDTHRTVPACCVDGAAACR